jgi:predicted kinase
MRPRVVLITGEPGSGKTTLGTRLARELRVPFLARDDVRGGLFFTAGAWTTSMDRVPSADEAVEVFLHTLEGLLAHGVSCVAEYVVRAQRPADLDRFLAVGECVVVMTVCADASARVAERNAGDRLVANPAFLHAVGFSSVQEHTEAVVERMRTVAREMARRFTAPLQSHPAPPTVPRDDGFPARA